MKMTKVAMFAIVREAIEFTGIDQEIVEYHLSEIKNSRMTIKALTDIVRLLAAVAGTPRGDKYYGFEVRRSVPVDVVADQSSVNPPEFRDRRGALARLMEVIKFTGIDPEIVRQSYYHFYNEGLTVKDLQTVESLLAAVAGSPYGSTYYGHPVRRSVAVSQAEDRRTGSDRLDP